MLMQTLADDVRAIADSNTGTILANQSGDVELKVPKNTPFFLGFKIPDNKKVFQIGMDVSGTDTVRARFYNSEGADVQVTLFYRS